MTRVEKAQIEALPTIGYWSNLDGVEVKRVEHGIDNYLICVSGAWSGKRSYHRVKIKESHAKDSRTYIELEGVRLYLDECLRSGV